MPAELEMVDSGGMSVDDKAKANLKPKSKSLSHHAALADTTHALDAALAFRKAKGPAKEHVLEFSEPLSFDKG